MIHRISAWVGIGSLTLLLVGCSNPVTYYRLQGSTASAMPSQLPAPTEVKRRIGVGPILLPKLLNRPQLVLRQSKHALTVSETHQWGGRLQEDITQLFVSELQGLHPQDWVYAFPADAKPAPQWQWTVEIQQLDGELGGQVQLQAICRLLDRNSRQPVSHQQVSLQQQTASDRIDDYVDTLNQLLIALVQQCQLGETEP